MLNILKESLKRYLYEASAEHKKTGIEFYIKPIDDQTKNSLTVYMKTKGQSVVISVIEKESIFKPKEVFSETMPTDDPFDIFERDIIEETLPVNKSTISLSMKKEILTFFEKLTGRRKCFLALEDEYFTKIVNNDEYKNPYDIHDPTVWDVLNTEVKGYWQVKELDRELTEKFLETEVYIRDILKEREKNKPVTFDKKRDVVEFYFEGYSGKIHRDVKDGEIFLKELEQKEEYKINTKNDIEKALDGILDKVHKKMRIKNIHNPPMYFFERVSKKTNIPMDASKYIFEELRKHIPWNEIEEKSAKLFRRSEAFKREYVMDFRVFKVFEHYFFFETTSKIYYAKDKEEVQKKLEEVLFKQVQERTKSMIERF